MSNINYVGNAPTIQYPDSTITKLAFDNRFTDAENLLIEMTSLDSPEDTSQQRQIAATLRINQRKIDRATFVDLARPDTRAGVQHLEVLGLLAPGRALEILDAPIEQIERPT